MGEICCSELLQECDSDQWNYIKTEKDVQIFSKSISSNENNNNTPLISPKNNNTTSNGVGNNNNNNNNITNNTGSTGVLSFMGRGFVRAPPRVIYDAVRNPFFRRSYDSLLKSISVIAELDSSCTVTHMMHQSNACMMTHSRDFVLLHRSKDPSSLGGIRFVHSAQSMPNDVAQSLVPTDPKVIRGQIYSSGWIIEPINKSQKNNNHNTNNNTIPSPSPSPSSSASTTPSSSLSRYDPMQQDESESDLCLVSYIARIDLRGAIPSQLMNWIGIRQPLAVHYIRKYIEAIPQDLPNNNNNNNNNNTIKSPKNAKLSKSSGSSSFIKASPRSIKSSINNNNNNNNNNPSSLSSSTPISNSSPPSLFRAGLGSAFQPVKKDLIIDNISNNNNNNNQ